MDDKYVEVRDFSFDSDEAKQAMKIVNAVGDVIKRENMDNQTAMRGIEIAGAVCLLALSHRDVDKAAVYSNYSAMNMEAIARKISEAQ